MHQEKISIIGLGGAGCRIIGAMADRVQGGPAMVAVNTDARSLSQTRATSKLQIGSARTKGRGTGGDPNIGRLAAEGDVEMIRSLVAQMDLVVVIAGLGGGTGTGAAPVVLRVAREENATTLCFVTLPLGFEGRQRRDEAERAIPLLRDTADALITVPNQRLVEFVTEKNVADSFDQVDQILATGIGGIWKLLTRPGFISLDFANLQRVLRHSAGVSTFGYGDGRGKNRAEAALDALLSGPLLEGGRVFGQARSLLISIAGGPDLALKEVGDIMAVLTERAQKDAEMAMGTVIDDDWKGRLTVTVIASEQWKAPADRMSPEPPTATEATRQQEFPLKGARSEKPKQVQTSLRLDGAGRGRFQNVEPTLLDGQDLDIPAFLRRQIAIER